MDTQFLLRNKTSEETYRDDVSEEEEEKEEQQGSNTPRTIRRKCASRAPMSVLQLILIIGCITIVYSILLVLAL